MASTPIASYPVPNLINGVSQQAPSQRRDTQHEAQLNCINSPVDGAIARAPSTVTAFHPGLDLSDGYYFDIIRSDLEKHRVVLRNGEIRVFDLQTGVECTVNKPDGVSYLTTSWSAQTSFRVTPVEDYVFIVNRAITPAMNSADTAPSRPYEGILYFRGANFLETYTISITFSGNTYTWKIQTVSNASNANSAYVQTDYLAEQLQSLLRGGGASNVGVVANPGINLEAHGFTVSREAFCIHISHPTIDWTLKVSDGSSGDILRGIKGQTQSYDNLPAQCIDGFTVKVRGDNDATEDDYWVQFSTTANGGSSTSGGVWTEVPKPGSVISLNAATMPHALVSLGGGVFRFEKQTWGKRVSGDGVTASRDPEFVGEAIEDIFLHRNRLGILTNNTATWSKARQFFTFFPDSAQTALDTDPISYTISHTKVALLSDAIVFNGQLMFWADGTQFVVQTGDVLKESTLDILPATEFSFSPKCRPVGIGSNIYFSSTNGQWANVWEFFVTDQGTSKDANDVSSQVPSYIPASLFVLTGSSSERILVGVAENDKSKLWVHNFYISGNDKLQSAWNVWQLPSQSEVLWATFDDATLRLLVQRPDGVSFEEIDVQPIQVDDGLPYLTRLDRRLTEEDVSFISYDAGTDTTSFVTPFLFHETLPILVTRHSSATGALPPGTEFVVELVNSSTRTYRVAGDIRGQKFYLGQTFEASITMSPFYPKDQNGVYLPVDRLQISRIGVVHSRTGYYRAEVQHQAGKTFSYPFEGRVLGSPTNNTDTVVVSDGDFKFPVKANARKIKVKLINDTWLPSAWQSAEIQYSYTARTRRG